MERVRALTDQLEAGITGLFQSGQYAAYLQSLSKLHHYSYGNIFLIKLQCPHASMVAGYGDWKRKFGRHVKAGETGITILAPCPYWARDEVEETGPDGQTIKEQKWVKKTGFTTAIVFDVSQTDGRELPSRGVEALTGTVEGYEKLLSGCRTDAEARWPRQCAAIRSCLARLAEYEAAGSEDLDTVSGCFGELMAELFDYKQDHWSPELRSLGFHLGKFIYLMDAYDDLARDKRKGAYNPLKTMSEQPGYEEEMREIFELLLARCAKCFERLPCVEDADLLRNILYSGVWLKYNCNNAKRSGRDAEAST